MKVIYARILILFAIALVGILLSTDAYAVTYSTVQSEFVFATPSAETVWEMGSSQKVMWEAHTDLSEITLSLDKGRDKPMTVQVLTNTASPQKGGTVVTIPWGLEQGADYRLHASGKGGLVAYSEFFEIRDAVPVPELVIVEPGTKSVWKQGEKRTIRWTNINTTLSEITFSLRGTDGSERVLASGVSTRQGSYDFVVSTTISPGVYKVRASGKGGLEEYSESFLIEAADPLPDEIVFGNPHTGVVWETGTRQTIIWKSQTDVREIDIDIVRIEGVKEVDIQNVDRGIPTKNGSYTFSLSNTIPSGSSYRVRASGKGGLLEFSDTFSIKNRGIQEEETASTKDGKGEDGQVQSSVETDAVQDKREQVLGAVSRIQGRYSGFLSRLSDIAERIEAKIDIVSTSRDTSDAKLLYELAEERLRKAEVMNAELVNTAEDVLALSISGSSVDFVIDELYAIREEVFAIHRELVEVITVLRTAR